MWKKISAVLTAVLVALGFSVAAAAPSFASTPTTQIRCTSYQNFAVGGGLYIFVPARPASPAYLADCILWKNTALPQNVATTELQLGFEWCEGVAITVDGVFGPMTESAVKDLQQLHHLTADGVYGNDTKGAMAFITQYNSCRTVAANIFS